MSESYKSDVKSTVFGLVAYAYNPIWITSPEIRCKKGNKNINIGYILRWRQKNFSSLNSFK